MSAFGTEILSRLKAFNSAPVLFVGAGMSKRYLDAPSWDNLLEDLAKLTEKDYSYYKSRANEDLPQVANLLTKPLTDLLWTDAYQELREKRKGDIKRDDSALKIFAAEKVRSLSPVIDPDLLEEKKLLSRAVVDAVITTNYDQMLESIFPKYEVFVGQDELVFSDPKGVGEIYKIHGSIDAPNSLVLTAKDYEVFDERNAYLAAKLLTLFVEHPVVFLGYSMSDANIIAILSSLVRCLKPEHVSTLQDRLFFVRRAKDGRPTSIASTVISVSGGISIPVVSIEVQDFKELFTVLGQLERKFSAHVLRRLKEHVYELVLTNDPKGQLYVTDLEDEENGPDVVVGVGAVASLGVRGYSGLTRDDLIADILHGTKGFDPEMVVLHALPTMLSRPGNLPFIKFMREAGFLGDDGSLLRTSELDEKVIHRFNDGANPILPAVSQRDRAQRFVRAAGDFDTLISDNELKDVLLALGALPVDSVDPEKLRQYLVDHENEVYGDVALQPFFVKAVCLYDRLVYYPQDPWLLTASTR